MLSWYLTFEQLYLVSTQEVKGDYVTSTFTSQG